MLTPSQKKVLEDNVKKGTRFLDKNYPGWRSKSWKYLDVSSNFLCPLSLSAGIDYQIAMREAGIDFTEGIDYGFCLPSGYYDGGYEYLEELWTAEHNRHDTTVVVRNPDFFEDKEIGITVDGVQMLSVKIPAAQSFSKVAELGHLLQKMAENIRSES